jgi:hypothetical protein
MVGSAKLSITTVTSVTSAALLVTLTLAACTHREESPGSVETRAANAEDRAACFGDSLRPAAAAPAPGLWLNDPGGSGVRVAAMIGPSRPDDRSLALTRPVESVEVTAAGDTIRHRIAAASVSLELLPPPPSREGPTDAASASAGRAGGATEQPAATYAPSLDVRLASYEPCATSPRGPRIRYIRRDAAGRIVIDVMLRRASGQ